MSNMAMFWGRIKTPSRVSVFVSSVIILFYLYPTEAISQTAKPSTATIKPAISRKPLPAKKITLPDLLIERISLNSRNEIILSLKNRHSAIDRTTHKNIPLKVCLATKCTTYYLGKRSGREKSVDPAGTLARKNSKIQFNTHKVVTRKNSIITTHINHTKYLKERNYNNNTAKTRLQPKSSKSNRNVGSPRINRNQTNGPFALGNTKNNITYKPATKSIVMPGLSVNLIKYTNKTSIDMPAISVSINEYINTAIVDMPSLRINLKDHQTNKTIDMLKLFVNLTEHVNSANIEMPMLHIHLQKHIKDQP
ncbi:MAG: hypothetical protein ABW131_16265 [Candidatus Sedimenticola sp. 6PFRAG5]